MIYEYNASMVQVVWWRDGGDGPRFSQMEIYTMAIIFNRNIGPRTISTYLVPTCDCLFHEIENHVSFEKAKTF